VLAAIQQAREWWEGKAGGEEAAPGCLFFVRRVGRRNGHMGGANKRVLRWGNLPNARLPRRSLPRACQAAVPNVGGGRRAPNV